MSVDPIILAHLAASAQPAASVSAPATPDQRRAQAAASDAAIWSQVGLPAPDLSPEIHTIAVGGYPAVDVRVYRPRSGILPAVITFFGGAYRQGSNDYASNHFMHASRAINADVVVIAVDYALAPEHKWPTQLEQGIAVLAWVHEHATELSIAPERIALGGQSSGANLAASVALANRDREGLAVALQVLEVPLLDCTLQHLDLAPIVELGMDSGPALADAQSVITDFLPADADPADPVISPLLAPDLSGLPRTAILAAEYDVLRGDAIAYHSRLREAGVDSATTIALGMTHDSALLLGALEGARAWHRNVCAAYRSLHE